MVFNAIALVFVVTFLAVGSKKGFLRELAAFFGLCAALVITTGKLDFVAVAVSDAIDASPLAVAIIAYIIVLGVIYGCFKLVGRAMEKLVSLQNLGQKDKYGGAVIGAVRGWIIAGAVIFVAILLPLPREVYDQIDQSVLAKTAAKTVQFLYDGSSKMHRTWPDFVTKVEASLTTAPANDPNSPRGHKSKKTPEARIKDELALRAAMSKVNFFYGDATEF
jgi:uncharacterized membrane protein required for colicin V production